MSRREGMAVLACMGVALLAFASALGFGFVYDDHLQLVGNPNVHDWDGLRKAWTRDVWSFDASKQGALRYYRPLFMSLLTVLWQAFGQAPFGYHFVSLLLHLGCGVLLVRLGIALGLTPAARVAALAVFLLHPLQIQSVAWVSAVSEPLFGCLALGCSLAWVDWLRTKRRRRLTLALILYGASILVLERAAALAAPLLLLGWHRHAWLTTPIVTPTVNTRRRAALLQASFLAIPVACAFTLRRSVLGPSGALAERWLLDTLLTAPSVAQRYLLNVAWPAELSIAYPHHMLQALSVRDTLLPLLATGSVLVAGLLSSRGHAASSTLAGSALCLMAPALAVGLLPGHGLVQDRYAYVPLAFGSLWLASLAWPSREPDARALTPRGALYVGWVVLLLALHRGNLLPWEDNYSLYSRAAEVAPDNPIMLSALAMERQARGEDDPTCSLAHRAAELVREHPTWSDPVSVNVNLGHCELEHGHQQQALVAFDRAYVLSKGTLLQAGLNRVRLLAQVGRVPEALRAGLDLTRAHPQSGEAWSIYGLTLAVAGQPAEAEAALHEALQRNPGDPVAIGLLARLREQVRTSRGAAGGQD